MTTEEKAKSYDEAIDKVAHFIKKHIGLGCIIHPNSSEAKELFNIFPEFKENENEEIRKDCIKYLDWEYQRCTLDEDKMKIEKCVAWLEKQGEKDKKEINNFEVIPGLYKCVHRMFDGTPDGKLLFEIGNVYKCLSKHDRAEFEVSYGHSVYLEDPVVCKHFIPFKKQDEQKSINKIEPKFKVGDWIVFNGFTLLVNDIVQGYYRTISIGGLHNSYDWNIDNIARLWTIQEARDGDVLVDVYGNIGIFEKIYGINWHTYCYLGCKGSFISEGGSHGSICYPATKEQCDLLFQKMREAGYVWDENKKELRKIGQKPIDKVEPKFHKGEWIACKGLNTAFIININDDKYEVEFIDGNKGFPHIDYVDRFFHLWTLEDAKIGDVLYFSDETIVIFKDLYNATTFHSYCHIEDNVFDVSKDDMPDWWEGKGFKPATKEQCNLLFQKMKEAGYIWDNDEKELRKIDQNIGWSEEDDHQLGLVIGYIDAFERIGSIEKSVAWLKSLKQRLGGEK